MRTLTLASFRSKYWGKGQERNFRFILNSLQHQGAVLIQQSGFSAHSLHHPKIVIIVDKARVLQAFNKSFFYEEKPKEKPIQLKEVEKTEEVFDYCGYVEAVLEHIPLEFITYRLVDKLHDYVVEQNNIELDKDFTHAKDYAKRFLLKLIIQAFEDVEVFNS